MKIIPVAAVLLTCLLPSFGYANAEGSGLKTIFQVLLEYEDQHRTKAWFKITSTDTECFNAAYFLYQESTNKKGEEIRHGYGSGEDAYKRKAATFFLARVIAQKYFPIERIIQLSEKEKASARKHQTLEALSLLQANRALACSIDYAVSQKYTEPQDIFGAIQLLSNNGNEKNIDNLEKAWKKSPKQKEKQYGPYFELAKAMRAQPCKITDNFQAAKVINDYTAKYVIQSFSNSSNYLASAINECRAMFGSQAGMSCKNKNKNGIKECVERD